VQPTFKKTFDISDVNELPHVEIIYGYQGVFILFEALGCRETDFDDILQAPTSPSLKLLFPMEQLVSSSLGPALARSQMLVNLSSTISQAQSPS